MSHQRIKRLNSLLQEVIAEVLQKEVENPHIPDLVTITRVALSKDLRHAKVYFSIMGDEKKKKNTLDALQSAAGFISICAAKKVVIRYFPALNFCIDNTIESNIRIEQLLDRWKETKKPDPEE